VISPRGWKTPPNWALFVAEAVVARHDLLVEQRVCRFAAACREVQKLCGPALREWEVRQPCWNTLKRWAKMGADLRQAMEGVEIVEDWDDLLQQAVGL